MNLIEATDLRKTYRLSRQSTIDTDHVSPGGATEPPLVVAPRQLRLARRHLWLIPGLAIAFYANAQAGEHGLGLGGSCCSGSSPTSRPCWVSVSRMPVGRWHPARSHFST